MTSVLVCSIDDCERVHYARGLCRAHYDLDRRLADPERKRASGRRYYLANRQQVLARLTANQAANRAEVTAYYRRWKAANPERSAATRKTWDDAHPDASRIRQQRYREAHPEAVRAAMQRYRDAHPDAGRIAAQRYRDERPGSAGIASRKYREAHPDANRLAQHKRRARKSGGTLTRQEWEDIRAAYDHRCYYCGAGDVFLEVEHMVPLSRGGRHDADNVVPSCKEDNRRKGKRSAIEYIELMSLIPLERTVH